MEEIEKRTATVSHIYRYTYNNNILLGSVPGEEFFSLSRITARGRYEHPPTLSLGTRYKKFDVSAAHWGTRVAYNAVKTR